MECFEMEGGGVGPGGTNTFGAPPFNPNPLWGSGGSNNTNNPNNPSCFAINVAAFDSKYGTDLLSEYENAAYGCNTGCSGGFAAFEECVRNAILTALDEKLNLTAEQISWLLSNWSGIIPLFDYLTGENFNSTLIQNIKTVINECISNGKKWEDFVLILSPIEYKIQDPFQNLAEKLNCFNTTANQNAVHSVTLYVDQPIPGQRNPYKTDPPTGIPVKVDVGHTWLTIKQTINGQDATFSFGLFPVGGALDFITVPSSKDGEFSHDQNRTFDVSVAWDLSVSNFNSLITNLHIGTNVQIE